jgi:hypothetical protein
MPKGSKLSYSRIPSQIAITLGAYAAAPIFSSIFPGFVIMAACCYPACPILAAGSVGRYVPSCGFGRQLMVIIADLLYLAVHDFHHFGPDRFNFAAP